MKEDAHNFIVHVLTVLREKKLCELLVFVTSDQNLSEGDDHVNVRFFIVKPQCVFWNSDSLHVFDNMERSLLASHEPRFHFE